MRSALAGVNTLNILTKTKKMHSLWQIVTKVCHADQILVKNEDWTAVFRGLNETEATKPSWVLFGPQGCAFCKCVLLMAFSIETGPGACLDDTRHSKFPLAKRGKPVPPRYTKEFRDHVVKIASDPSS